jgi:hypothetical protein
MQTSDEVAAKLPLGLATLGGQVSQGTALDLSYFVTGTATATRDVFQRADLADNPKCADATHVVWAYGLGAYDLASKESSQVAGRAAVSGVGAEASHDSEKATLRRAGKLEDCSKVDNFACRVPIRVTLRSIQDATLPPPPAIGTAPAPGQPDMSAVHASMQSVQYKASAEQKYMSHDGAGCLADLDQADRTDPQGKMGRLDLRARCEMRAGRCDEGKAHFREARRAWYRDNNPTGLASDATVEHEVEQLAMNECPSAGGGGKSGQNRALELTQKVMQASMRKDTNACVEHGNELDRLGWAAAGGPMRGCRWPLRRGEEVLLHVRQAVHERWRRHGRVRIRAEQSVVSGSVSRATQEGATMPDLARQDGRSVLRRG